MCIDIEKGPRLQRIMLQNQFIYRTVATPMNGNDTHTYIKHKYLQQRITPVCANGRI